MGHLFFIKFKTKQPRVGLLHYLVFNDGDIIIQLDECAVRGDHGSFRVGIVVDSRLAD